MLVKLERLDFLRYVGLFAIGVYQESGRFYRDPVHRTLEGIGPQAMVLASESGTDLPGCAARRPRIGGGSAAPPRCGADRAR